MQQLADRVGGTGTAHDNIVIIMSSGMTSKSWMAASVMSLGVGRRLTSLVPLFISSNLVASAFLFGLVCELVGLLVVCLCCRGRCYAWPADKCTDMCTDMCIDMQPVLWLASRGGHAWRGGAVLGTHQPSASGA